MLVYFDQAILPASAPSISSPFINTSSSLSIKGNLEKFQCANAIIVQEHAQHGQRRTQSNWRNASRYRNVLCYVIDIWRKTHLKLSRKLFSYFFKILCIKSRWIHFYQRSTSSDIFYEMFGMIFRQNSTGCILSIR